MNKKFTIASLILVAAILAPVWTIAIAGIGIPKDQSQYDAIFSVTIGMLNLLLVVPALVFLVLARKMQSRYKVSLAFSLVSVVSLSLIALMLRITGSL